MAQIHTLLTRHYLQVFRAGTAATSVVITTALAAAVNGGVRQSTVRTLLGTSAWATPLAMHTVPATIRSMGFLLGV